MENNDEKTLILDRTLERLLFKLRRSRWLHRRASHHYRPRHLIMIGIVFLVSESVGILGIVAKDSTGNNKNIVGYTIAIISVLNGFLTLITDNLGYRTKVSNNKLAAEAYDLLATQVNFEKDFPSGIPIKEFAISIEEEIIKIKNNYKVIPEERFEKELNSFLEKGGDISSDAGFGNKTSFLKSIKHVFTNNKSSNHIQNTIDESYEQNQDQNQDVQYIEPTRIQVQPYENNQSRGQFQLSPFSVQRNIGRLFIEESDIPIPVSKV